MSDTCHVPPAGWYCTRKPGHDGPCAALPEGTPAPSEAAVDAALHEEALWRREMGFGDKLLAPGPQHFARILRAAYAVDFPGRAAVGEPPARNLNEEITLCEETHMEAINGACVSHYGDACLRAYAPVGEPQNSTTHCSHCGERYPPVSASAHSCNPAAPLGERPAEDAPIETAIRRAMKQYQRDIQCSCHGCRKDAGATDGAGTNGKCRHSTLRSLLVALRVRGPAPQEPG